MSLPSMFVEQMKNWLGQEEWSALQSALEDGEPTRGVRLHRFTAAQRLAQLSAVSLEPARPTAVFAVGQPPAPWPTPPGLPLELPVPWFSDGYYIPHDAPFGKHVYHEAGAYYLQEPSAMAVVTALNPQPGERVLDLCAAPGGKSTAIAQRMHGEGLFVANEIHPSRAQVLVQNVERLGIPCVVTADNPLRLQRPWAETFDAILVDAPCSGEGMFRKDKDSRMHWSTEAVEACADRQRSILTAAVQMLKPGGRLVYSTCTLNPVENEQMVVWAMQHLSLELEPLPEWPDWDSGRSDWTSSARFDLSGTRRLWPHRGHGEGHFVARFRKPESTLLTVGNSGKARSRTGQLGRTQARQSDTSLSALSAIGLPAAVLDLPILQGGRHTYVGVPTDLPLSGVHVLRPGVCAAVLDRNHWEPHHHLAMALSVGEVENEAPLTHEEALAYFRGESLPPKGERGYCRLTVDGMPVGWAKQVADRMNNLYPRGLRKSDLVLD